MRFTLPRLVLVLALMSGGAALAQQPRRQVTEFQAPREMTPEEREAAKQRAMGNNLNAYGKDIQVKEKPTPWMAIGLAGLVFVAVTPFALRAYRNTSKEIAGANTFGANRGDGDEEEA
ncbi:hypothetical protein HPC49_40220 [Pyxidicoccus fallax]|uniref:Uncharacterized protein n=1 Tax=Pyxidicoccus fallax TaxID=394095 RepID=A0A848LPP6_9BACT|nr:hypothetical protein [Pyxidicoccus fallax]NMO19726.1 hypothetical protein [Pyxidicoccus fallax]NPC84427.1 hypothetical protein [Pyxidicoccus fallax]